MTAAVLVGAGAGAGIAVAFLGGSDDSTADFCRVAGGPYIDPVAYVVFLHPSVSEAEAREVGEHLDTLAGVEDLRFVDQEEAYQEALDLFEGQPRTQDLLDRSDVPPSWRFRYDGPDLRSALSRFDAIREITDSDQGPSSRMVDLLGTLAEGRGPSRFWTIDPTTIDALRESVPGDVSDEVEPVPEWLANADSEPVTDDPPPAVRSAAATLVAAAEEHCGLRPNMP